MSRQEIEGHVPMFGILLLFLGTVFLLQTLNILPWGLWGTLWHFWPVLIIVIGLSLLLARYNRWLVSLLNLGLLFACLGIAVWQYGPPPAGQSTERLGALEVDESRFPKKGDYYLSGDFEVAKNRIELDIDCNLGRVQIK